MNLITNNLIAIDFVAAAGFWDGFVTFLKSILTGINGVTNNFGLSVIIFTILMRVVLLPLDLKAKASTKKMSSIQPELQKVNEKYKNDSDKKNQKTMELYKKHGVNPLGGCLPMLIQLPIFFALFAALRAISDAEIGNFLAKLISDENSQLMTTLREAINNSDSIKGSVGTVLNSVFNNQNPKIVQQLAEVIGQQKVDQLLAIVKGISPETVMDSIKNNNPEYMFLWIKNVWIADSPIIDVAGRKLGFNNIFATGFNGMFILPVLAGASSYLQMKFTNQQTSANQQTKGFTKIFPLISVWFCSIYTAAFAIYWVSSNIFQIVQQVIYNKISEQKKEGSDE